MTASQERPAAGLRDLHERGPVLPYPSSWYCLALSGELRRGAVLTRRMAGEDVVLYRTRDGRVHAVRPYCPHLGAHLGVGGTVAGQDLVCPFHRFAFGPDGSCVSTPAGPPPRARVEHHTVRERNGFILAWYAQDGAPPGWEVPDTTPPGIVPTCNWSTDVGAHVQELTENTTDLKHLPVVHRVIVWDCDGPHAEGPYLRTDVRLGPVFLNRIRWEHRFLLAGMGSLRIELPMPALGLVVFLWVMHSPTGPRSTRLTLACAAVDLRPPRTPAAAALRRPLQLAAARAMLAISIRQVQEDVRIWNAKRYEPRPRLAAGDEGIGRYRHWVRQFYPADHPSDTTG